MSDFWKTKRLEQMSSAEWESLCDGCGRCCLNKLEDIDSGEIVYTNVACRLLDTDRCRCTHYVQRHLRVPDCVRLTPRNLDELRWMPPTCAYRLLNEGRPLPAWHPLVSGRPETVHEAGISVRGRIVSERDVPAEELADYIVDWPNAADAD